jgi:hypothetical protein
MMDYGFMKSFLLGRFIKADGTIWACGFEMEFETWGGMGLG